MKGSFPFSDNLTTLLCIAVSDLNEAQRESERDSQVPFLFGEGMSLLTPFEAVRTVFVELFCTPKSSMENPSLRVSGHG